MAADETMGDVAPDAAGWLLAVDLGGTRTRVALVAAPLAARAEVIATFPTEQRYADEIVRLAEALAEAQGQATGPVVGVGVALGGRIARDGSGALVAPNLRDYEGRPFVQEIAARCGGLPTRLAHDAVCGLLAERRLGALIGAQRCAYLTLSTGTGCAIHLEASGGAGVTVSIEMGHQLLDGNARVCLCGQTGCLETWTGGKLLGMRYGQAIETLPAAEQFDLWRGFSEKLSLGLVNLVALTRVERVAIGGAIALHHPELLDALRAGVAER
ncbi:MAG TPA: ROK family protein, partial [Ktedonobacterales bacterium]